MSRITEQIKAPIKKEMETFEKRFYESIKSDVPLLKRINHYIARRKGKQLRPLLVFLSAKVAGGTINDSTYNLASLIELTHTATLVHDDVVDDSHLRRGLLSINAIWNNKIAILVGDYLMAKGLIFSSGENIEVLKIFSRTVAEMSEGELLQIEKSRLLDITESDYFEIIRQKTATLLSACCEGGVRSVSDDAKLTEKFKDFGTYTGIAFQIKDDLFDYQKTNFIGKPVGIDIQEQKLTLPLIYSIDNADAENKKWLKKSIKKYNKDKKRVAKVIDYVNQNGGMDYATQKMKEYHEKALDILYEFPKTEYRDSLELLVNYVIEREV